jgi:hypothetical protein
VVFDRVRESDGLIAAAVSQVAVDLQRLGEHDVGPGLDGGELQLHGHGHGLGVCDVDHGDGRRDDREEVSRGERSRHRVAAGAFPKPNQT